MLSLVPVASDDGATARQVTIGYIHIGLAAGFFLTLAYFALVLFRKTEPSVAPTHMKLVRNMVYTFCGYTILMAIALIAAARLLLADSPIRAVSPIFWLESLACVAFGISWFVKGEAILKDRT
jgi:formate/nitrite transporter FocA (FNT family)